MFLVPGSVRRAISRSARDIRESLIFFSWAIVLYLYLVLEYKWKIRVLGAFVITIAFLLILASTLFAPSTAPLPEYFSQRLAGRAYDPCIPRGRLLRHSILHRDDVHHSGEAAKVQEPRRALQEIPPLDVLDELSYRSIVIGFPLLTLAMVTGSIWADSAWGSYWGGAEGDLVAYNMVYLCLIPPRRLVVGWRGRKAAYFAVIGFLIVLFTFLGVNLLLPGRHAFK